MPSSQEILEAAANAQRSGRADDTKVLMREYKRMIRLEAGLPETPTKGADKGAGFFENVAAGLGTGAVSTLETIALGAATIQEEEAELETRRKIKNVADKFKPEGGDADSLVYKGASGLGSLLTFVPAAFTGKAAIPVALGMGMAAGGGEASERARDYGATEEERNAAIRRGLAIGSTEVLPVGRALGQLSRKFGSPGLENFLDNLSDKVTPDVIDGIKSRLKSMAATGVAEGAQEATAAILQNLNEAGYNPEQVAFEMGVVEEGAIGGSAGAIFQGIVDLIAPKRGKKLDTGDTGKIRVGERHSDETQEEFDARQRASRAARGDTQPDMFSDELDDAEINTLEVEQTKERIERARLEDPDEVEFDLLVAEEGREQKEKEEAKDQEERDKQITIDEAIEDAKDEEYDKGVSEGFKTLEEQRRAESDLETKDARRKDEVQKKTAAGRRIILDEVFDSAPEKGSNVRDIFRTRLAEAGYRDPEPNASELQSIKRFLDVKTAEPAKEVVDSNSDLATLESQIKEKGDVGKQATRAPDTKTTGDSVPSSPEVVGEQRADSTVEPARPVEGRLDDSKRDTGRPVRRKGRKQSALIQNVKAAAVAKEEDTAKEAPTKKPESKQPIKVKGLDSPQVNPDTGKLRYRRGRRLITAHDSLQLDMQAATRVAGMKPAKDVGRLSQDAKKVLAKPERKRTPEEKQLLVEEQGLVTSQKKTLTPLNKVAAYFAAFDKPMDAMYNAAYEIAEAGSQMNIEKGDPMKSFVSSLGISNAKEVRKWMKKNLSKKTVDQFDARVEEFKTKIASEKERAPTQQELNQEALERQDRATRVDPDAVKARQKRMTDAAETRAAKKAEQQEGKKKLSKEEKASIKATEEFLNALNNPKTNPRNAKTYQRLKTLAEKTDDPQTSLEALDAAAAKKIEGDAQTTAAKKAIDEKKVETGELKQEDLDAQAKIADREKLYAKFVGKKGITRLDVLAAIREHGYDYVKNEATPAEVLAAGDARAKENGMSRLHGEKKDLLNALKTPVSQKINLLLLKGDIKGALLEISKTAKAPQLKNIARALADNMGTTKVQFVTGKEMKTLVGEDLGDDGIAFGGFLHRENTIVFNEDVPLTLHTVMHEATHAALDLVILRNPKRPAVKFINRLYEESKDQLGTAYGAESIYEFVAEAMSNPAFRSHLSGMKINEANAFVMFMRHVANILRSLVGLDTKPVDRSEVINLDIFDQVVERIMAPNPDAITKLELKPSLLSESILAAINPEGKKPRDIITTITDYIKNFRPAVSSVKAIAQTLNLQSLSDLAKSKGVGLGDVGQQLLVDVENQQGLLEQYKAGVDKVLKSYDAFLLKHGMKAKRVLDRIIYNENYGATIYQVDPTKNRSDYEGQFDAESNVSLEEVYDAQQDQLNSLSDEAKDAVIEQFTSMRNEYKKQWSRLRRALKVEFDALAKEGDAEVVNEVARKIDRALFAKGELEVYFPLVRQGKFRVSFKYNPEDRPEAIETGFLMFENLREREAFIEDIPNNPMIVTGSDKSYDVDFSASDMRKDAPNGSFVADILGTLDKAKVPEGVQDDILRMYVQALPETSYARSLTQRLGTFGYIQSARVAMNTKGYSLASQSAKIESASKIRATKRDIEAARDEANNPYATAVANTLINSHADFAMKGATFKGLEEYFKRANQVAFIYTLGFNISSALVNMTQIPLFAIPYLAPRYGFDKTVAAVSKAIKMVSSSNNSMVEYYDVTGEGIGATYTLKESLKKSIRENSSTEKEAEARIEELTKIIPLIKMAHLRGKLPTWDTLQDVGASERAGFLDKMAHLSAYAFSVGERFNTQSTLLFTYDLTLQEMEAVKERGEKYFSLVQGQDIDISGLNDDALQKLAAEEAIYQTQEVNAGGRLETAAPISKQNFGRVMFMYKSYGLQMYYSMFKSFFTAVDLMFKGNKKQRKIARQQLAGIHLSAVLFAGVGGIPLYGLVSMIYDLFAEEDEDTADEVVRKHLTELGFKGPLSQILGSDIAARVKLTDLIFQENRFMRDPSVEELAGHYLGGPALSTGKRIFRGFQDFAEGNVYRGFEAVSPGGIGNMLQSIRYFQDDGVMTRRGDYIYDDITGAEVFSKFLGFAPLDYTFQVEQNSRNKRIDTAVNKEKTRLLKKYYVALRFSDFIEMAELRKDMREFNLKHPTNQISPESVIKSMKSHVKTSADMYSGVTISPLMRYAIEQSNLEYKQF